MLDCRTRLVRGIACAALFLTAANDSAGSQELRGTVRDSASNSPILGAVMVLLDSARRTTDRGITNENGEYRIPLSPEASLARVVRLGFRPREVPVPQGATRLDIHMVAIPALLEPVRVRASAKCPSRSDATQALALLEQARAGLLSTIVAREGNPATMKLILFERTMDGNSDRIESQKVHFDSSDGFTRSFSAVGNGATYVRNGFLRESEGRRFFDGPDAEVLLDDDFAAGYCFRLAESRRERPNQVGLGFFRADGKRGRVDIDGTLWVDTVARALRDIQFNFVGIEHFPGAIDQGGYVSFREMPTGYVLVDRWGFSLVGANQDITYDSPGAPVRRTSYYTRQVGGEVARALWPDGRAWKASLGTFRLSVVDEFGRPAKGVVVKLAETDYTATPDARGMLEIADVLPGPYRPVFVDTSMVAVTSTLIVRAERDSVSQATLVVPPEIDFRKQACIQHGQRWTTARVVHEEDGSKAANAKWELGSGFGSVAEIIMAYGLTGSEGRFGFCESIVRGRTGLQLRVAEVANPRRHVMVELPARFTDLKIELPSP